MKYSWTLILLIALPILFLLSLFNGSVSIPMSEIIQLIFGEDIAPNHEIIILKSRLPKAITAVLCGVSLSVSGLLMQTLFRNPLAGPYLLGISSGAGLGVALLVLGAGALGFGLLAQSSLTVAAILGAIAVMLILFLVSLRLKDVMSLLILGIMIGSIATAIIGILQYFSTDYQLKAFLIWTLGSLEGLSYQELFWFGMVNLLLVLLAFFLGKALNVLLLGEEYMQSLGYAIYPIRLAVILISGTLAGMVTAFCGPIGFVGIIVPHLARLITQSTNHFNLIPISALLGAVTLLLSDLLCSVFLSGISLPINSITSLIGIPIILWILFKKQTISSSF